jgi:hypothetical protein
MEVLVEMRCTRAKRETCIRKELFTALSISNRYTHLITQQSSRSKSPFISSKTFEKQSSPLNGHLHCHSND